MALYACQIASTNLRQMENEKPRPVQVVVDTKNVAETPLDFITTTAPQARYLGCLKTKRSGRKEPVMWIIGCDYHPSGQ
ncbi:MAG: hypothetical protein WAL71_10170, partial [Terriglobales bacterium]